MSALGVFVSSVQRELALERAAIAQLISLDPFLLRHCKAVLFENEPSAGRPSPKAYLDSLAECQIYLLIIDIEYGRLATNRSATHEEYRLAQQKLLPTLVFIHGLDNKADDARESKTREFLDEIKRDGHKYVRFHDREDLKPAVRAGLYEVLKKQFDRSPAPDDPEDGEHLIEVASEFETETMPDVPVQALSQDALARFVEIIIARTGSRPHGDASEQALVTRGLALPRLGGVPMVNRAAFLLFAPQPANRFPHCEILADAYDEPKVSGKPKGQVTINAPILSAVEQALQFVDGHTFHPRRVVGLNNLRLEEYPVRALREALINAVAHRSYDDATRRIMIRIYSDRIEIASPGYPLKPLTLAKLRRGNYRPCSRNPLIAQTLASLDQMEQRGTGFARMHEAMLNHGLEAPVFGEHDGYFVVTFAGPNGNYDRIKTPSEASGFITPAIEDQFNERQQKIVAQVLKKGSVTSGWCRTQFGITYDTANRDLLALMKLGILERKGSGPATRYEMATRPPQTS
jgi:predicted HTH transcriptional regulator